MLLFRLGVTTTTTTTTQATTTGEPTTAAAATTAADQGSGPCSFKTTQILQLHNIMKKKIFVIKITIYAVFIQ